MQQISYNSVEDITDDIRKQMSMSKKAFKKGLGRLLREEKVEIKEDGVSLKKL